MSTKKMIRHADESRLTEALEGAAGMLGGELVAPVELDASDQRCVARLVVGYCRAVLAGGPRGDDERRRAVAQLGQHLPGMLGAGVMGGKPELVELFVRQHESGFAEPIGGHELRLILLALSAYMARDQLVAELVASHAQLVLVAQDAALEDDEIERVVDRARLLDRRAEALTDRAARTAASR